MSVRLGGITSGGGLRTRAIGLVAAIAVALLAVPGVAAAEVVCSPSMIELEVGTPATFAVLFFDASGPTTIDIDTTEGLRARADKAFNDDGQGGFTTSWSAIVTVTDTRRAANGTHQVTVREIGDDGETCTVEVAVSGAASATTTTAAAGAAPSATAGTTGAMANTVAPTTAAPESGTAADPPATTATASAAAVSAPTGDGSADGLSLYSWFLWVLLGALVVAMVGLGLARSGALAGPGALRAYWVKVIARFSKGPESHRSVVNPTLLKMRKGRRGLRADSSVAHIPDAPTGTRPGDTRPSPGPDSATEKRTTEREARQRRGPVGRMRHWMSEGRYGWAEDVSYADRLQDLPPPNGGGGEAAPDREPDNGTPVEADTTSD